MTRTPYVHHSTIGRSATNSVAALFKERIIKSHDEHYLENSNNEEVDFDHHHHPRARRLEDYYDYTPDPVVQQHPWYSNIMLLLLIAMILFTIIYALYQLYQSRRQCHHLMYSAHCATKPLGGGDDMSDVYSMQPSQTAAASSPSPPPPQQGGSVTTSSEWKNTTQVEMVPPASSTQQQEQPQNHNEYISMGEKPATAGVAMV